MDTTSMPSQVGARLRRGSASRFSPPRSAIRLVERPDLIALAEADALGKVTVLAAPHGSGKTAVLQSLYQYFQAQEQEVRWLSLGPQDNEPDQLRQHLMGAFELQVSEANEALPDVPAGIVGFIDGLEQLSNPLSHALAEWFMLSLPESSRLFVSATRMRGTLLRNARLRGLVSVVAPEAFRFTAEQAHQLLGEQYSLYEARYLNIFVDGWAAGLRFLQGNSECCRRLLSCRSEKVLPAEMVEYFDEQFAAKLAPESLLALMELSVFERFNPALVAALPEARCNWQQVEEYLALGLFLDYLEPERHWVEFHPAFSLYLTERLRRQNPERFEQLKVFAARWFLQAGLHAQAMSQAVGIACVEKAAQIMEDAGGILRQAGDGGNETLEVTIAAEQACRLPLLFMGQLYQRIRHGRYREARAAFDRAWALTDGFTQLENTADPLLAQAWAYLLEVMLRVTEDSSDQLEFIARLEQDMQAFLERDPVFAASLGSVLVFSYVEQARYESALRTAALSLQLLVRPDDQRVSVFVHIHRAVAQLASESVAQALMSTEQALQRAQLDGVVDSYEMLCAQAVHAVALYESGEWEQAQHLLQPVLQDIRQINGWMRLYWLSYSTCAAIAGQQQGFEQADRVICEGERFARERGYQRLSQLMLVVRLRELCRAQRWQAASQLVQQDAWTDLVNASGEDSYVGSIKISAKLCEARLVLELGRPHDCLAQLAGLEQFCSLALDAAQSITLDLLVMRANYALRRFNSAFSHFSRALANLYRGGYIQRAREAGAHLLEVLHWERRQGKSVPTAPEEWLKQVVSVQGETPPAPNAGNGPRVAGNFVLSPRETEIIGLIAQGCINKEIAARLGISEGTVKGHRKNIHEKLGVSSRSQAISRARELLLI